MALKLRQNGMSRVKLAGLLVGLLILVAVAIPEFVGHQHHSPDKRASADTLNFLMSAVAHSDESDKLQKRSEADLAQERQVKPPIKGFVVACSGEAGKVRILPSGFIKKPFVTSCSPAVVMFIGVTESTAYAAAADRNGSCVFQGHTDAGVAQKNRECSRENPDWPKSEWSDSVVSDGLFTAMRPGKGTQ